MRLNVQHFPHRQIPNPNSRCVKNRVDDARHNRRKSRFAHTTWWFVRRHKVNVQWWHLVDAAHRIIMEISLFDNTVFRSISGAAAADLKIQMDHSRVRDLMNALTDVALGQLPCLFRIRVQPPLHIFNIQINPTA